MEFRQALEHTYKMVFPMRKDQVFLIDDAVAFFFVSVILGQPDIGGTQILLALGARFSRKKHKAFDLLMT